MRITFSMQYRDVLEELNRSQEAITAFQQQVSSGRRLNVASDDPQAAAAAVAEHAALGTLDQYVGATRSTTSHLTVIDTALSDIITQITAAKTTAASARSTVVTVPERQAIAGALQGIKQTLVSDLSASFQGTYVFSGAKTTTVPYTITNGTVSAYQGDSGSASIDVDRHIAIPVTFNGQSIARGSDANDVFTEMDTLITAVQNGDSAGIDAGIAALDRAFTRATTIQTTVGNSLHRLDDQTSRLATIRQRIQMRISDLEDADMVEAISGLEKAQTAQRAALGAAATIDRQNLMDYLK